MFTKSFFGSFLGKIAAAIFIAVCLLLGFGPEKWVEFLAQGSTYLTPSNIRALLLTAACFLVFLLLLLIVKSPNSIRLTAKQLEYGLAITGLQFAEDKLGKRKRNIQIGFGLKNVASHTIRYDVDSMFVSVNGETIENPKFNNMGLVLRSGESDLFQYDVHRDLDLPPECPVVVSINVSYGEPNHPPVRHLKREYLGTLRVSATKSTLIAKIAGEDWDQPI